MHHRRASVKLLLAGLAALGSSFIQGSAPPKVEVTRAFRGQVSNYDDPCFWQDPQDASRAVACITSKDGHRVECFDLKDDRRLDRAAATIARLPSPPWPRRPTGFFVTEDRACAKSS